MMSATKFYLVSAEALPEIFIKVAEAKRMLQSGEVRTAGDAARAVGIAAPFISTATRCVPSTT